MRPPAQKPHTSPLGIWLICLGAYNGVSATDMGRAFGVSRDAINGVLLRTRGIRRDADLAPRRYGRAPDAAARTQAP